MMNVFRNLVATSMLLIIMPTCADEGDIFINISHGQSQVDSLFSRPTGSARIERQDTGHNLTLGYQLTESFGIAGFYSDLGQTHVTGNSGDTFVSQGRVWAFQEDNSVITADLLVWGIVAIYSNRTSSKSIISSKIGWTQADMRFNAGFSNFRDTGYSFGFVWSYVLVQDIHFVLDYQAYTLNTLTASLVSIGMRLVF